MARPISPAAYPARVATRKAAEGAPVARESSAERALGTRRQHAFAVGIALREVVAVAPAALMAAQDLYSTWGGVLRRWKGRGGQQRDMGARM